MALSLITVLPPICLVTVPTSVPFKQCSATPTSPPRRSTLMSPTNTSATFTRNSTVKDSVYAIIPILIANKYKYGPTKSKSTSPTNSKSKYRDRSRQTLGHSRICFLSYSPTCGEKSLIFFELSHQSGNYFIYRRVCRKSRSWNFTLVACDVYFIEICLERFVCRTSRHRNYECFEKRDETVASHWKTFQFFEIAT